MNIAMAIVVLCFSLLYLFEGIDIAIRRKSNRAYQLTHIVYPLYMVGVMFYFLVAGVIK